ncbi:MAG: hypothetical protein OEY79_01320, partial [Anaplasmataceae bacterium]|nr:hypothetical protein [Anaplasmataceae bacterium]
MKKRSIKLIKKFKKFFYYICIISLILAITPYIANKTINLSEYSNKILKNIVKSDNHNIALNIFGQTKLILFTLDFKPYIEIHDINIGINNRDQYIINKTKLYLNFSQIYRGIFTISTITIEDSNISLTSISNIASYLKLKNINNLSINLKNIKLIFNDYINNININDALIKNQTINSDIDINNKNYNIYYNFNNKDIILKLKSSNLFIDYDTRKEDKIILTDDLYQLIDNIFKKNNIINHNISKISEPIKLQIKIKDTKDGNSISIKSKIIDLSYISLNKNNLNIDIKKADISDIFNQNIILKNPKYIIKLIERFPQLISNLKEKQEKKISIENLILNKNNIFQKIKFSAIKENDNKLSIISDGKFNNIKFDIIGDIYSEHNHEKLLGAVSLQDISNKDSNKISSFDLSITKYFILLKNIILHTENNGHIDGNIKISKSLDNKYNINSNLNVTNYIFKHEMFSYLKDIFVDKSIFADQNIHYKGYNNIISDMNNLSIDDIELYLKAYNMISDYNIKNITSDQMIGSIRIIWNDNSIKKRLDINSDLSLLNYKLLGIEPINDFKNKKLIWSKKLIELNKKTDINGIINIKIDHLKNPDIVDIDKILINGEIQKNNIKIDKFIGSIKNKNYNTTITSNGTIKIHDELLFNIFVDLQNTNINFLLNKLFYINDINGIMNIKGAIISNGRNITELIQNINGKFTF